jgi:hypothetical protein
MPIKVEAKRRTKIGGILKLHYENVNFINNLGLAEFMGMKFPCNKHLTQNRLREKLAKRKQQKNK